MKNFYLLLFCCLIIINKSSAQTLDYQWSVSAKGNSTQEIIDVEVDTFGNSYICGIFAQPTYIGTDTITPFTSSSINVFVAKLDFFGNLIWVKQLGGTSLDEVKDITLDSFGNLYITGKVGSSTANYFTVSGSNDSITLLGGSDAFITKLDTTGNHLWSKVIGGSSNDIGHGVAVDMSGNVYLTGEFRNTAYFNNGTIADSLVSNGASDAFVVKYDSNGNYLWSFSLGSTSIDGANSITVDNQSNLIVIGRFVDVVDFNHNPTSTFPLTASSVAAFVAKYDANGIFLWAAALDGAGVEIANSVTVDIQNNIYISGQFNSTNFSPSGGVDTFSTSGGYDAFLVKYSPSGSFQWARVTGGTAEDLINKVTTNDSGIYIVGNFRSPLLIPLNGNDTFTLSGNRNIFVIKYDTLGTYLWGTKYGNSNHNFGTSIANYDNSVFLTGHFNGSNNQLNFGATGTLGSILNSGGYDGYLVQLKQSCVVNTLFIETACYSYNFNGNILTTSGQYTDTFTAINNCDSIVTINLTILDTIWSPINVIACESYYLNGQTYTTSGHYQQTFTNALGCDSIVSIMLTINQNSLDTISGQYCDAVTINGNEYLTSGLYTDTFVNATTNCDSIVVYDITILNSTSDTIVANACDSYVFNDTSIYTTSGIYNLYFQNNYGCDSITVLVLSIDTSPSAYVIQSGNTLTASSADAYQWINCSDNSPVSGADGQIFVPLVNGNYAVVIMNEAGCSDTSDCYSVSGLTIKDKMRQKLYNVFPNPAKNTINIVYHEPVNALIKSFNNRMILSATNTNQLSINNISQGIYLLYLIDQRGNHLGVEKLIIE